MSRTTVCFLVSGNPMLRRGVSNLMTEVGCDFRHVQDVESVNVESLLATLNGCIVIDADSYPNGVSQLASLFVNQHVSMPIIALSAYQSAAKSNRMQHLRQGAFETLQMPDELERFREVVYACVDRDMSGPFSPSAMRIKLATLTARERETIGLFLEGDNTKVVAKALDITYQTVDKHRGRALRKIGVRTVVELKNQIQLTLLHCLGMDIGLAPRSETKTQGPTVPVPHFDIPSSSHASL